MSVANIIYGLYDACKWSFISVDVAHVSRNEWKWLHLPFFIHYIFFPFLAFLSLSPSPQRHMNGSKTSTPNKLHKSHDFSAVKFGKWKWCLSLCSVRLKANPVIVLPTDYFSCNCRIKLIWLRESKPLLCGARVSKQSQYAMEIF